ncbi:MAG: pilus assembly protein PilC [Candidatus Rokubacteria bacterium GWC2_70_24]|nr:MAG: pilus assembly protein PilC [Candidatus Rokubacteria bacterium GWA2_70_23]OGK87955.1 MAG: pilus assembly protein PilC [Candidatus Rokubacteria bacterium GWC2_70_24]HAM55673.1 pilus assembly protein PilC [Candidatus Rokubacteria bacterium]
MPVFSYRGRGARGLTTGEVEAPDRMAAVGELRNRAILVTKIEEKAGGKTVVKLGGKVNDREMAIFTRQFSTMIDAGLPLVQCLNILAEQSESKTLRAVTANVARQVEAGSTLAESLRRHPRTFDDLFTNLVQVGEAGGILDVVLQRLSVYIEKAAALKRKVKAAMVYPSTIIGVAFLIVIFMLTFVIPTFATMFKNLGADLPLPTQIVLWMSDFVRGYIIFIILGAMGAVYLLRRYYKTENGKSTIDALLLKLPVFGTLIRKVAVARFTRTFGTLVSSGVPILEGLRITARTAGNKVVERAVMQCRAAVTAGKTLAEPLKSSGVFPPMVTQMIAVGEQTGALDAMLNKIADFYDDEVDTAVGALTALLEPLMIVILGVIIGGLVVAMYLPIFRLVTLIK